MGYPWFGNSPSVTRCLCESPAERDLIRLQKIAMREGLPYQTLISSILHKFINGRLVETTGVSAEQ